MTTQETNVPKYFLDFVQENARQYQELASGIHESENRSSARIDALGERVSAVEAAIREIRGELRIIRALGVAIFLLLLANSIRDFFVA